jgi:hypothetical protein
VPPEWFRPDDYLGSPVGAQFVLARSPNVVLTIRHVLVYPNGFEFQLECLVVNYPQDPEDLMGFEGLPYYTKPSPNPNSLPDGLFRFGVQLPDGSKATTLQSHQQMQVEKPDHPVLMRSGSGGIGTTKAHQYWLWPLPPPGRLAFVCEWPSLGIAVTRHEIDTAEIRDAAQRSQSLWLGQSWRR